MPFGGKVESQICWTLVVWNIENEMLYPVISFGIQLPSENGNQNTMCFGGDEGHPNHHLRILRDAKGIKIHDKITKGAPNPDVSIGVYTSIKKGAKKNRETHWYKAI